MPAPSYKCLPLKQEHPQPNIVSVTPKIILLLHIATSDDCQQNIRAFHPVRRAGNPLTRGDKTTLQSTGSFLQPEAEACMPPATHCVTCAKPQEEEEKKQFLR